MKRRSFVKEISLLSFASFSCENMNPSPLVSDPRNFKFILSSDLHYGELVTNYESLINNFIVEIKKYIAKNKTDFIILNGDIIHDNPKYLPLAKNQLDTIGIEYFVNRGNHDMVSEMLWQQTWGKNLNYILDHKGLLFIFLDTSNIYGHYLSPDLIWLENTLNTYSKSRAIFLIIHIPQTGGTANAIENPAFVNLVRKYECIKGIFHGHEHDQDGIFYIDKIPCIFDSHIGGRWGTSYNGFRVVEVNVAGFNTFMYDYTNNVETKIKSFVF